MMKKLFVALATVAVALAFLGQSAEAAKKKTQVVVTPAWGWWWWGYPWNVKDPKLATTNLGVRAAATGTYWGLKEGSGWTSGAAYGVATAGCVVVSPIVGTAVMNRPLTQREVWVQTGNCAIPVIGGYMVNAWFDRNGWK
jgi:hypothetical protein